MLAKIDLTDAFATEVAVIGPSPNIEYANKKWNEFGVVLTRAPDDVSARRLQNQFEECMNEQSCSDEPTPSMSASFGVALWPEDGDKAAALLRTADQRMYANKHRRQIA